MFTLTNHRQALAATREFAHTQSSGLIDPGITAETFTEKLQRNAQIVYAIASDAGMRGQWPLPIEELRRVHRGLCAGLQTGGGELDPHEASKYEASCATLKVSPSATASSW